LFKDSITDYEKALKLNQKHSGARHRIEKVQEKRKSDEVRIENTRKMNNLFKYACAKLRDKEFEKAVHDLNQIIELAPQTAFYYVYRGVAYSYMGLTDKSKADFDRTLEINHRKDFFYYNCGLAYQETLDFDNALVNFNLAIEINPNIPDYYFYRGLVFEKLKQFADALVDYQKAMTLDPNHSEAERSIQKISKREEIENAKFLATMDADIYFNSACTKLGDNDYENAIADLSKTIQLFPSVAYYYVYRGVAHKYCKHETEATADFAKANQLNPNMDFFYYNSSRAKLLSANYSDALEDIDQAIELNSENSNYYFLRGNINETSGKINEAIDDYNMAHKKNPSHPEAFRNLTKLQQQREKQKKELKNKQLNEKKRLYLQSKAHEYFENARYYMGINEYENSIEQLNKALSFASNTAFYFIYRGVTHQKLGKTDEMKEDFKTAQRLNTDVAMFHFNKGKAEFDAGNFSNAIEEVNKAIEIKPRFVFYNYRMTINRKLGKSEETIRDRILAQQIENEEISNFEID